MNTPAKTKLILAITVLTLAALACQAAIDIPNAPAISGGNGDPDSSAFSPPPTLSSPVQANPVTASDLLSQQDALINLYRNVSPGVVALEVHTEQGGGTGTGFVIDKEGHIVTNYHVVEGAVEVQVTFPSGIKVRGEVIGTDTDSDLAVVKVEIDPADLFPIPLGNSNQIQVGQVVVAIGNPFGLNGTMTTGIVSGLGRTLDSINATPDGRVFTAGAIIQTDAAINPGNSGGPLLNLSGEIIGINRAIRTFNTNADNDPINSGIGFAISINIVKRVAPSLIKDGHYDYPYLGITSINEMPLEVMEELGLKRAIGAVISGVAPDGPADDAGLVIGDVILQINGVEVLNFGDLIAYLFTDTSPGDIIQLVVFRNGEELQMPLTLGVRP